MFGFIVKFDNNPPNNNTLSPYDSDVISLIGSGREGK